MRRAAPDHGTLARVGPSTPLRRRSAEGRTDLHMAPDPPPIDWEKLADCFFRCVPQQQPEASRGAGCGDGTPAPDASAPSPTFLGDPNERIAVSPPYYGTHRLSRAAYQRAIDEPTPEEAWFTPREGWSDKVEFSGGTPPSLMQGTRADRHFLPEHLALGELRVEILETSALPSMETAAFQNDVYAMFIFEDSIARTATQPPCNSPQLHSQTARALRFPIFAPHSMLHVALFDSDETDAANVIDNMLSGLVSTIDDGANKMMNSVERTAGVKQSQIATSEQLRQAVLAAKTARKAQRKSVKTDDAIGRVVLPLAGLYSGVVYDGWLELRSSAYVDDAGNFGAVRLRYSVTWTAPEWSRVTRHLAPPPAFVVPVASWQIKVACAFALHGTDSDPEKYKLHIFLEHAYEFKDLMKGGVYALIDWVSELVLYKRPVLSLGACGFWQAACLHPRLLASAGPLMGLAILASTYHTYHGQQRGVRDTPGFLQITTSLLLPRRLVEALWVPPPMAPSGTPRTQAQVVAERKAEAKRKEEDEAVKKEELQQLEDALKAKESQEKVSAVVGQIGSNVGGLMGEAGMGLMTTCSKIGGTLRSGNVIGAATAVVSMGVRAVAATATKVANVAVDAVRTAYTTAGDAIEETKSNVADPTVIMASTLIYYQAMLGEYLGPLRALRGLLTWENPLTSTWLSLVLVASALLLPWLPWLYMLHIMGLAALGPHMWVIGYRQRRQPTTPPLDEGALRADAARRFASAKGRKERKTLLRGEARRRERAEKDAKAAQEAEDAKLPFFEHAQRRRDAFAKASGPRLLEVRGSRVKWLKHHSLPDPERSFANSGALVHT